MSRPPNPRASNPTTAERQGRRARPVSLLLLALLLVPLFLQPFEALAGAGAQTVVTQTTKPAPAAGGGLVWPPSSEEPAPRHRAGLGAGREGAGPFPSLLPQEAAEIILQKNREQHRDICAARLEARTTQNEVLRREIARLAARSQVLDDLEAKCGAPAGAAGDGDDAVQPPPSGSYSKIDDRTCAFLKNEIARRAAAEADDDEGAAVVDADDAKGGAMSAAIAAVPPAALPVDDDGSSGNGSPSPPPGSPHGTRGAEQSPLWPLAVSPPAASAGADEIVLLLKLRGVVDTLESKCAPDAAFRPPPSHAPKMLLVPAWPDGNKRSPMAPRDDALCKAVLDESARFREMMAQSIRPPLNRADGIVKLRDTIELFVSKCAPPPPTPPPTPSPPSRAPKIMPLLVPAPAAPDSNTLCATMLAEFARIRDVAAMTSVLPLNEKALAHALERTTTTKTTTSVVVRRRLAACPTFLEASHADLQGRGGGLEDGVNYVSASCDMDSSSESSLTVSSGQTYKIAKHPSVAVGEELVLDRKATEQDQGRHFAVSGGNLEVTGLTLTGGYAVSAM
jgi:hypothetical protein